MMVKAIPALLAACIAAGLTAPAVAQDLRTVAPDLWAVTEPDNAAAPGVCNAGEEIVRVIADNEQRDLADMRATFDAFIGAALEAGKPAARAGRPPVIIRQQPQS